MINKKFLAKVFDPLHLLLAFFFLLYAIFRTINSTADAYTYGFNVKYNADLFQPHHLLYNALNRFLLEIAFSVGTRPDVLEFMKFINAVSATMALYLLYRILQLIPGFDKSNNLILLFFAGSSYAVMRFSTDAETYMIPIVFSLAGSYYFLKSSYHKQNAWYVFLSSGFAAVACLFHQIHFFWWLGLLISYLLRKQVKGILIFCLAGLIVPVIYCLVLIIAKDQAVTTGSLFTFVFHDYTEGSVKTSIGLNNFILTGINLGRTLFQVHPKVIYLLKVYPFLYFFGIISVIILINSFLPFRRFFSFKNFMEISRTHGIIFLLQVTFAWVAVGNAEFMVMLPFAAALILPSLPINYTRILFLGVSMLIWNLSFGIVPDHVINYLNDKEMVGKLDEFRNHQFILKNSLTLSSRYKYETGFLPLNLFVTSAQNIHQFEPQIIQTSATKNYIITDFGKNKEVLSRRSMLENKTYEEIFSKYRLHLIDSVETFYGADLLYAVLKKP